MLRTAIVLDKNLEPGAAANTAAVLMGQLAGRSGELYAAAGVTDREGRVHAGIIYNVVILKASRGQLLSLCARAAGEFPGMDCVVFSEIGRSLSNSFPEYVSRIGGSGTEETGLVGVALSGDEEAVKAMTRKFSLY